MVSRVKKSTYRRGRSEKPLSPVGLRLIPHHNFTRLSAYAYCVRIQVLLFAGQFEHAYACVRGKVAAQLKSTKLITCQPA